MTKKLNSDTSKEFTYDDARKLYIKMEDDVSKKLRVRFEMRVPTDIGQKINDIVHETWEWSHAGLGCVHMSFYDYSIDKQSMILIYAYCPICMCEILADFNKRMKKAGIEMHIKGRKKGKHKRNYM